MLCGVDAFAMRVAKAKATYKNLYYEKQKLFKHIRRHNNYIIYCVIAYFIRKK